MSLQTYETRVLQNGFWRRFGRPDIDPVPNTKLSATERQALHTASEAAGQITYVPGGNTTALLPGYSLVDLAANAIGTGSQTAVSFGTTPVENALIWGQLSPSTAGASSGQNLAFAGPRPDLADYSGTGMIREVNENVHTWSLKHSYFNPFLWTMPELNPPGGAWSVEDVHLLCRNSIGVRGGRYQIEFCEFVQVQDAFNVSTAMRNLVDDPIITNRPFRRHNWVHKPLWYKGPLHSQPEGTHGDLDQNGKPMYMLTEYNLFGGETPGGAERQEVPGRNLGDGSVGSPDGEGQGTFLQQETNSGSELRLIRNCDWRRNIYWQHPGDGYNINHYYDPQYPNSMDTVFFTDNLHVVRGDAKYVNRNQTHYSDAHINHRLITMNGDGTWTDVGAAPITNG